MKVHIFVQARLGSTRLKNKILKDVINKTSAIKFLNDRLKKIKSVDKIVYLIPAKDKHKLSRIIKEFDGSFFVEVRQMFYQDIIMQQSTNQT